MTDTFDFCYPLMNGLALVAEIEGRCRVHAGRGSTDAILEIEVRNLDFHGVNHLSAVGSLKREIEAWLWRTKRERIEEAADESRRGQLAYDREIARDLRAT